MTPNQVLPANIAQHIVTTDECWLWTGNTKTLASGKKVPYHNTKGVRNLVRERVDGIRPKQATKYVLLCENEMCLHPDHLISGYSTVGRMLFIKETAVRQGDCLIWTGMFDGEWPRINVKGKSTFTNVSVHRFVYMQEHNVPEFKKGVIDLSCGNSRCVEATHINYVFRPKDGRCPEGHMLPKGSAIVCPHCKYDSTTTCSRGHEFSSQEATHVGNVGCWHCRREDAAEWIRNRRAELEKAGKGDT